MAQRQHRFQRTPFSDVATGMSDELRLESDSFEAIPQEFGQGRVRVDIVQHQADLFAVQVGTGNPREDLAPSGEAQSPRFQSLQRLRGGCDRTQIQADDVFHSQKDERNVVLAVEYRLDQGGKEP